MIFCWTENIFWMLLLSDFFLDMIVLFLLSKSQSEFFLNNCESIWLFLFLQDTDIIIQSELNFIIVILSELYSDVVNLIRWLLYAKSALFQTVCNLRHEFIQTEWSLLQLIQQLELSLFLIRHWLLKWFLSAQYSHL